MSDFQFGNASWGYWIWAVLVFAVVLFLLDQRGRKALSQFLSAAMQTRLVQTISITRRVVSLVLLTAALICFVFALMRPQWGVTYRSVPKVGAQVMVCLDVSKSMLAEDTAPNRLERAKVEVIDLMEYLDGDRVGLIAFAGKATILCPTTSDFGFLQMLLKHAGPQSVGRGGTNLEAPLRKAIEGFGDSNDASKVILLITDGEDHDSFPLEAAKEAVERGIKVIAIGFGDENGARIEITDPSTGLRSQVKDLDGKPVLTRLDGDMLRRIALETEGVYVPAGTGVLDLESIQREHIRPLIRGDLESETQAIRNEGFQWPLLAGFVLLILSVSTTSVAIRPTDTGTRGVGAKIAATILISLCLLGLHRDAIAAVQNPASQKPESQKSESQNPELEVPAASAGVAVDGAEGAVDPSDVPKERRVVPVDPIDEVVDSRATYNDSLALLKTDYDQAEELLTLARRHAGNDGEVRFRASYNLGWVGVYRADAVLESDPEESLQHLRTAADWFREAIRLNSKSDDARHNLEIVLRRILELSDSLADKDERDFAVRLDELISQERSLLQEASSLVEVVTRYENETETQNDAGNDAGQQGRESDQFDHEFRSLAVQQRQIRSDAQTLLNDASQEQASLQQKKEEELEQEEKIKLAQLFGLLHYANRAIQNMGQTRSQFRFQQSQRAYRRASQSLSSLKRARDQLREPAEIIRLLIADALVVNRRTIDLSTASNPETPGAPGPSLPAWLTPPFLQESQQAITERATELHRMFEAAFAEPTPEGADAEMDPAQQRQRERLMSAPPLLKTAAEEFQLADGDLEKKRWSSASSHQMEAVSALASAAELFLDLRGLIEAAYTDEINLQAILGTTPRLSDSDLASEPLKQLFLQSANLQERNLLRAERIVEEVAHELQQIDTQAEPNAAAPQPATNPEQQQQQAEAQTRRLEIASQLIESAKGKMVASLTAMNETQSESSSEPSSEPSLSKTSSKSSTSEIDETDGTDGENLNSRAGQGGEVESPPTSRETARDEAIVQVDLAVDDLAELRRLFFSIAELLRETAQRQANVNDETQSLIVESDEEIRSQKMGPLNDTQSELRQISDEISHALSQQAQESGQSAGNPLPVTDPNAPHQAEEQQKMAEAYAEASKLVFEATESMASAIGKSEQAPVPIAEIRPDQDTALAKLQEALAKLIPPEQQDQQQDQQQNENQEQQEEEQQEQQDQQEQNEQRQMNAQQLLQMIRDREAKRREDQEAKQAIGVESVLKDW